jgi:tRNA(Ile)-lysidine synthase
VLVALSGGPDSVALTHVLAALAASGELTVAGAAHFNHRLRHGADIDEQFAAGVAASLGLPWVVGREDVGDRTRREGRSVEAVAHDARYEFLERARAEFGAHVVALGHTRDDQAETFLLRLLRGAGARGLAGMHPKHGPIIRPLLECHRSTLKSYLREAALGGVEDETNADLRVPRNRVRHELLPLLEGRFNRSIVDVLADEAELARLEWTWMNEAAAEAERTLSRRTGEGCRIDAGVLAALPGALARLLLRRAMTEAAGGREIDLGHVERAMDLATGGGPAFDAPGQRLERIGPDVVLTTRRADTPRGREARPNPPANLFRYSLSIPGEVVVAEAGVIVSAERVASAGLAGAFAGNPGMAVLSQQSCPGPLFVRNRRPGDRFRPLGLGGQKKLQDFFVDRKVAREARDLVPIVATETDQIVWVAGHAIDDAFRVTDPAQAVLVLRLKLSGGPA